MSTPLWQVKIADGELQAAGLAGIEDIAIVYTSLAADSATLRTHPEVSWAYGTIVEIHFADTRRFLGRVTSNQLHHTDREHYRSYRLAGPWDWIERIPYRQHWARLAADMVGDALSSRVILNQDSGGNPQTVEAQLADIIAYAADAGAPLDFAAASVNLTLPFDEQREITCAQAIARCLRYAPDVCSWIDYAPATPQVHFGRGAAISAPAGAVVDVRAVRDDLAIPGVTLEIERIGSHNGVQYRTIETLSAGDTAALDAMHATLPLAGSDINRSAQQIDVATEPIPAPLTSAAWWHARHGSLSTVAPADITITSASRTDPVTGLASTDIAAYPRISINPITDLQVLDIDSRVERFTARARIIRRDDNGDIVTVDDGVELHLDLVTTSATTRTYRHSQTLDYATAETTPNNLAAEILAHYGVTYTEGSAAWPAIDAWASPGLTMYATPVQVVRVSSIENIVEVDFGPPSHLSIQDLAARLQGFRSRRASLHYRSRMSGELPDSDDINANRIAPARVPAAAPGIPRRAVYRADERIIDIDPAAADSGETMRPRWMHFAAPNGTRYSARVLAAEPVEPDPDEPDEGPGGEDPDAPPPCGHPGNAAGAGGTDSPDDQTHPGDAYASQDHDTPSQTDHPGDYPSPLCADDVP